MAKLKAPKQYTSTEVYFDRNGVRHRPGKVFTLPAGFKPGKTMTEVKAGAVEADAPVVETLSELAKAEHDAQGDALV